MSEEKKGLLQSIFGKKKKEEDEQLVESNSTERTPEEREPLEITEAVVDNARLTLLDILKTMQFDVEVVAKENTGEGINLEITGQEDLGLVIGKEGATLNSLQFLMSRILSKKYQKKVFVHLDANAYKEKKMKAIIAAAEDAANVAEKEKVQIALDPMNSAERRIVHMTLKQRNGIETFSRGEGHLRHIVVAPKAAQE